MADSKLSYTDLSSADILVLFYVKDLKYTILKACASIPIPAQYTPSNKLLAILAHDCPHTIVEILANYSTPQELNNHGYTRDYLGITDKATILKLIEHYLADDINAELLVDFDIIDTIAKTYTNEHICKTLKMIPMYLEYMMTRKLIDTTAPQALKYATVLQFNRISELVWRDHLYIFARDGDKYKEFGAFKSVAKYYKLKNKILESARKIDYQTQLITTMKQEQMDLISSADVNHQIR